MCQGCPFDYMNSFFKQFLIENLLSTVTMPFLQGIGNFNLNVFEQLRKFCRENYPAGALPSP